MPRLLIAVVAGITLAAGNFFLINIGFLGNATGQNSLMVIWLALMIAALAMHRGWLVYVAQTSASGLLLYRISQHYTMDLDKQAGANASSLFFIITIIIFSYFLAWLVARAL
jgi:hypothetical protein